MIAMDTETTGLDLHHSARPFFVTLSSLYPYKAEAFWEWDVNPETRMPFIPEDDRVEIQRIIDTADEIVFHNAKFDIGALKTIGIKVPWEKVKDTLLLSHLLNSASPHDLWSLTLQYVGYDIAPLEKDLEEVCKEVQGIVRRQLPEWRIATKQGPGMPSAKEKCWKFDTWMPRALAKFLGYKDNHFWFHVLKKYSTADSACTAAIWEVMNGEMVRRDLVEIYQERLKLLEAIYYMEQKGVTADAEATEKKIWDFGLQSKKAGEECLRIASEMGYTLSLPKGPMNKSLREFMLSPEHLGLSPMIDKHSNKTGEPSLDSEVLGYLAISIPDEKDSPFAKHYGRQRRFVKALMDKRKADTAISYMNSYKRFWLDIEGNAHPNWKVLYPNVNPTGTVTLRNSSNNPNEQNVSDKEDFNLRGIFGPAPGREWWSLDGMNLELRLTAYLSAEAEMIQLFERPNDPPYFGSNHLLTCHILHKELFESCVNEDGQIDGRIFKKRYPELYKKKKNGNFAVQYGAVPESGTADRAYGVPNAHRTILNRFQNIKRLSEETIEFARIHGYVETIPDKSVNPRRGYPLVCSRTEWGDIKPTVPLSYKTQGTACQWKNRGLVRSFNYLRDLNRKYPGKGYYLIIEVHDELVFDFPKGQRKRADGKIFLTNLPIILHIKRLMEQGGEDIGIPTPVSVEYHSKSWAESLVIA